MFVYIQEIAIEKAADPHLYAVCTCLYIHVRMYTRLCTNLCVCEEFEETRVNVP
jgi:hypothetical protein